LSDGNDGLMIGALLGDHVKGPLRGHYPAPWEQGIKLHRSIDAFTDQHAIIRQSQHLFAPEYRRYAGIMLDVVFDHFLNQHWQQFHHQQLSSFSAQVYQLLDTDGMPAAAKRQASNLARYDILGSYQHWQTVERTLQHISQRLQRDNPLARSARQLQQHYAELERCFLDFYPQLQQHASRQRELFTREYP
jgi:acyl carrier protein phosphodiesterase